MAHLVLHTLIKLDDLFFLYPFSHISIVAFVDIMDGVWDTTDGDL